MPDFKSDGNMTIKGGTFTDVAGNVNVYINGHPGEHCPLVDPINVYS
jgi:hypothetical protein